MTNTMRPLRLGTRASALARWQAEHVAARLRAEAGVPVELVFLTTTGDRQQTGPLASFGGQGVFTKELQRALLENEIDLAVHSLKDLPTERVAGLELGAVPPRAATADVLVARVPGTTWRTLPIAAVVGTGSLRRRAQLWHVRPDLTMIEVRGNVDTRLRKLAAGEYDALILAEAGLQRLELLAHVSERLAAPLLLPAVGQGALGIEIRADDATTRAAVQVLDDLPTHLAVTAERALLFALRAGCLAPVGGLAEWHDGANPDTESPDGANLHLSAVVLAPNGTRRLTAESACRIELPPDGPIRSAAFAAATDLGRAVAETLQAAGAEKWMRAS